MPNHLHMMISIPPKYAMSEVVGFIKSKSAIHFARVYGERKQNLVGQHFWARGYMVSTEGRVKPWSGSTSATRSRKTSDWTTSTCGSDLPPSTWPNVTGAALASPLKMG
jgi:hypothetical protein